MILNKTQNDGAIKDKIYGVTWKTRGTVSESERQEREWEKPSATYTAETRVVSNTKN